MRQIFPKSLSVLPSSPNEAPIIKNIGKDNFQQICRCCVVNKGEINVFEAHFQNISFAELIHFCTNEKILPYDGMPKSVCNACTQQIINSFAFVKTVKEMQVHIHHLQKNISVESQEHFNDTWSSYNLPNPKNSALLENISNYDSKNETMSFYKFKQKYRGLDKIYKHLCNILRENKRQIRKPIKTKRKRCSLSLDKCVGKEISQEQSSKSKLSTECVEDNGSGVPTSDVNLNHIENISVPNADNVLPREVSTVENLLKSNNCQFQQVEQCNISVNRGYNEVGKSGMMEIEGMNCPVESKMEKSAILRNEYVLEESYREVVNDDIVNCEVYTVPEGDLKKHLEMLIQSNYNDIKKKNVNGHFDAQDEVEEARAAISGTQCFECPEVFQTETEIIRHCRITGHAMTDRFKCKLCSATFRLFRIYRKHVHSHNKMKCICEICGAKVSSTNLKRHMEVHTDRSNVCQFCGRTYIHKSMLDDHIRRNHLGFGDKSLCFMCGKSFKTATDLNNHLNNKHVEDGLAEKSYQCEMCKKYFVTEDSLTFHRKYTHSVDPVNRKKYLEKQKISLAGQKSSRVKGMPYKRPKPKQCTTCLKYVNPSGYKIHMLIHQGLKPFECKICYKHFRQDCHLKSHMYIHLNLKPYKCKYCQKCFRHSRSLITHVMVHTGERPHKCSICGRGFTHSTAMKKHYQVHLKQNARYQKSSDVFPKISVKNETESSASDSSQEND